MGTVLIPKAQAYSELQYDFVDDAACLHVLEQNIFACCADSGVDLGGSEFDQEFDSLFRSSSQGLDDVEPMEPPDEMDTELLYYQKVR